jgi:hypothetical protein
VALVGFPRKGGKSEIPFNPGCSGPPPPPEQFGASFPAFEDSTPLVRISFDQHFFESLKRSNGPFFCPVFTGNGNRKMVKEERRCFRGREIKIF